MRHEGSGVPLEEENFDEAERAVNTVLVAPSVPDSVASIFSSDQCDSLTAKVGRHAGVGSVTRGRCAGAHPFSRGSFVVVRDH